jgi:laccase
MNKTIEFTWNNFNKNFYFDLGDWYDGNVEDIVKKELETGDKIASDAFTINGFPGDLFNCSQNRMLLWLPSLF